MFDSRRYIISFVSITFLIATGLLFLGELINSNFRASSATYQKKLLLTEKIHTASPAIIPSGRNIAFETGNALANAPASYLNLLDCCESDEAIADRIAVGLLHARVIKKNCQGLK